MCMTELEVMLQRDAQVAEGQSLPVLQLNQPKHPPAYWVKALSTLTFWIQTMDNFQITY